MGPRSGPCRSRLRAFRIHQRHRNGSRHESHLPQPLRPNDRRFRLRHVTPRVPGSSNLGRGNGLAQQRRLRPDRSQRLQRRDLQPQRRQKTLRRASGWNSGAAREGSPVVHLRLVQRESENGSGHGAAFRTLASERVSGLRD